MEEEKLKLELITAYFEELEGIIAKIRVIRDITQPHYDDIAMPALYALIERIAYGRYVKCPFEDRKSKSKFRFKKLLTDYSGQKEELEKIDIVFLFQWDKSLFKDDGKYKKAIAENHSQIKAALLELYGDNISIHMRAEQRFQKKQELYDQLRQKIPDLDFKKPDVLDSFTRCSVVYLYGRCSMIHEGDPSSRGFIDIDYLFQLVTQITENLKNECQKQQLVPRQLE